MERLIHFMAVTLYTDKSLKIAENLINKELNKYIQSKVGGYNNGQVVKVSLEV
jgi:hypothetical protein